MARSNPSRSRPAPPCRSARCWAPSPKAQAGKRRAAKPARAQSRSAQACRLRRRCPPRRADAPKPMPPPCRRPGASRRRAALPCVRRRHRQGWPRHQGRHAGRAGSARRQRRAPVAAPAPSRPAPQCGARGTVPMTRLRKTIALRLKESQNTAAQLTTFNEVDMTRGDGAARRPTRTASRRSMASSWASWASSPRPASRR